MLTADFARLGVTPGMRAIDVGAGLGRHTFELYRRGADVTAFDQNADEMRQVTEMLALCADLPVIHVAAGEVLIGEGSTPERLLVLAAGIVTVERDGTPFARIEHPGAIFGEMSWILGTPATATARAATDVTVHVVHDERVAGFVGLGLVPEHLGVPPRGLVEVRGVEAHGGHALQHLVPPGPVGLMNPILPGNVITASGPPGASSSPGRSNSWSPGPQAGFLA